MSRWMRLRFTFSATAILRLPKNGRFKIQLVEPAQQPQGLGALRPRLIVARTRHSQKLALLLDAQLRMRTVDP
jgi:hypothetical protein